MEIGESIIIGRMGQQPLHLSDASIDPQHATLTRTSADSYVIEDHDSAKGVFVFGLRIMRKPSRLTRLYFRHFQDLGQATAYRCLTHQPATGVERLRQAKAQVGPLLHVGQLHSYAHPHTDHARHTDGGSKLAGVVHCAAGCHGHCHLCWRKGARKEDRRFGHPQRTDANHLRLPALPQISWLRPLLCAKRQKVLP